MKRYTFFSKGKFIVACFITMALLPVAIFGNALIYSWITR